MGYEEVEVLLSLSDEEFDALAKSIAMKPGHRKKLELLLRRREREEQRKDREWHEEEEDAREKRKQKKREQTEAAGAGATNAKHADEMRPKQKQLMVLPEDKDYFAFLSHKKLNSKNLGATENLALRVCIRQSSTLLRSPKYECCSAGQG